MTYAPQRSLTAELGEGLTDGSAKKLVRDRGGQVEPATALARRDLSSNLYGIREDSQKVDPFGRAITTPNYTAGRNRQYLGGFE